MKTNNEAVPSAPAVPLEAPKIDDSKSKSPAVPAASPASAGRSGADFSKSVRIIEVDAVTKLYLVGTAHVSDESCEEVVKLIEKVKPSMVFLELCNARRGIMLQQPQKKQQPKPQPQPQPPSQEQKQATASQDAQQQQQPQQPQQPQQQQPAVQQPQPSPQQQQPAQQQPAMQQPQPQPQQPAVKEEKAARLSLMSRLKDVQNGRANFFGMLYSYFLEEVSMKLDVLPGAEFAAAYEAAVKLNNGCQIVLGDRPVGITLKRVWGSLSLFEKGKLIMYLFSGICGVSCCMRSGDALKDLIEQLKNQDVFSMVIKEVSKHFPTLLDPLIHERDIYMTAKLKETIIRLYDIRIAAIEQNQRNIVKVVASERFIETDPNGSQRARLQEVLVTLDQTKLVWIAARKTQYQVLFPQPQLPPPVEQQPQQPQQPVQEPQKQATFPANSEQCIVAVVGYGHLSGIMENWPLLQSRETLKRITAIPPERGPSWRTIILIILLLIVAFFYFIVRLIFF